MTLSHKEFEKRWEQAHRKQHITQKKSSIAPLVHLSVLTILDNYMHQLHKAVDGHALSKEECDAVCEKIGSSRVSGKSGFDLQEEVVVIPVSISHSLDYLDLVVYPFQNAGVQSV